MRNPGKHSREMAEQAIMLIEAGKFAEGMAQLRVARKYDPGDIFYTEQIALAYAMLGKHELVIEELATWMHSPQTSALCFQVYGNAIDMTWNAEEAIKVYLAGLEKISEFRTPSYGNGGC